MLDSAVVFCTNRRKIVTMSKQGGFGFGLGLAG